MDSEALTRVTLAQADVAGGLALSDAAGWNQTGEDWALFIGRGRTLGCRSGDGALVATAAALPYGDQGWIAMVLVAEDWRHRGLATGLLGDCVSLLREQGATPVLDATPAGEPVYRRLGFAPGMAFERWEAELPAAAGGPAGAPDAGAPRIARAGDVDALAALEAAASRIERRFLVEAFVSRPGSRAWLDADGSGFVLAREGRRATQIGPLVAADERRALTLLEAALAGCAGRVFIDVPSRWDGLAAALQRRGFRRQRPFLRMALGRAAALGGSERLFAVAGPEFG